MKTIKYRITYDDNSGDDFSSINYIDFEEKSQVVVWLSKNEVFERYKILEIIEFNEINLQPNKEIIRNYIKDNEKIHHARLKSLQRKFDL